MKQPLSVSADTSEPLPEGYIQLTINNCQAVACTWAAPALSALLAEGTLHEWAAAQPDREVMHGRGVNYGVMLPAGRETGETTPVVVRRNRHGGIFAALTGEYFQLPTRAPLELENSLRLAAAGINTPEVIAFALYPVFMNFVRCDVLTRRLAHGGDLPDVWRSADAAARSAMLAAVATLLRALARAGARHEDLNLKNIYIAGHGSALTAYLLDVDRVSFPMSGDIARPNFNRLARSARKWRSSWGLDFDENSIKKLAELSREIS
jgi:3-deoxy-D-manno-octulosonic acid kinase